MKILVVGGGLQGLSCGASLYKKYDVDIVASDLACRKSRFFNNVYPFVSGSNESLFSLLEKENYDVLLPVTDFCVPFISKNKSLIESRYHTKCAVSDYSLVCTVGNKSDFMSFCEENRIPHPKTIKLTGDNMEAAAREVGFPSLIKPNFSVGARGITKVLSKEDLHNRYGVVYEKFGSCTLQEYIDNPEVYYNVMMYRNKNGKIINHTVVRIERKYPVDAGSSCYCVSEDNEELKAICVDCLEKLDWEGMADFDVLRRMDSGEYKIIEINPRVPACLRAADISGVNFPEIIVRDAAGEKIPTYNYTPKKRLRYLGLDIMWFLKAPINLSLRLRWLSFWGRDLFYQDIYLSDFSTWWTWLLSGLNKLKYRNKRLR